MKKQLLFIFAFLCFNYSFAQTASVDSIKTDTLKKKHKVEFDFNIGLSSRNYCRGANFGDGPSIQSTVGVSYRGLYAGVFGAFAQNNVYNYGNTIDAYIGYEVWRLNFSVHDCFFFNKNMEKNDFWFTTGKNSGRDGHYYEAQIKYEDDFFSIMVAYNFYNTTCDIFPTTFYLESRANVTEDISVIFAGATGPSAINFYGNTYNNGIGATAIGVNYCKDLKLSKHFDSELNVMAHINPSWQNISSDLQQNTPFNLVIGLTFN